jgi:hypothetical protein
VLQRHGFNRYSVGTEKLRVFNYCTALVLFIQNNLVRKPSNRNAILLRKPSISLLRNLTPQAQSVTEFGFIEYSERSDVVRFVRRRVMERETRFVASSLDKTVKRGFQPRHLDRAVAVDIRAFALASAGWTIRFAVNWSAPRSAATARRSICRAG